MSKKRVLICGAGAAGLTAAIFSAEQGADVTLLERTDKAGKKILMSGGTRCNVLPVVMKYDDYHTSSSANRMKNIFKSWSLDQCLEWFQKEIGLEMDCEVETNKWFPKSNSAKEVRNLLLKKVLSLGVNVQYNSPIERIEKKDLEWCVHTSNKHTFNGDTIIIATGGLSVPTIGTDGMGHKALKKIGVDHSLLYAALTPLTTTDSELTSLAGISLNVEMDVYIDNKKHTTASRNGFLFTHRGFSGPSILDVSHLAVVELDQKKPLPEFRVNWNGLSREKWDQILQSEKGLVRNIVAKELPSRLADLLCKRADIIDDYSYELKKEKRKKLLSLLTQFQLPVTGHEGYKKAEVTGGGIPLESIDTSTLELHSLPGIYLCGEILDLFGRIGGFNFYWAWVTGRLAGLNAS
jgi:predicted Rossmann fold flavoprotein